MKACHLLAIAVVLAGGLTICTASAQIPLPEQSLPGLDALLQGAVKQSPRMLNQILNLEIAENDRIQARSNVLPTAGGYLRALQAKDDRADQAETLNVRKLSYDLSINQPIFTWGERTNYMRMGQIRQKITQGQYQEAYRLLAVEIRSRYLGLINQKIYLQRTRFNEKLNQEQLRLAEERYSKKIISDLDVFTPRLNAERAKIDLERAEFEFENNRSQLARLTGAGSISEDSVPDEVPKPVGYDSEAFNKLVAGFLSQPDLPTAEAATLRKQLELDELDYQNQKVRLRPKFSLVAGVNQDELSYSLNVAQRYKVNSLYAGAQMNWTIFDGFNSSSATRISLARRRQHQNDYAETHERLAAQAQYQSRLIYFSARNLSIYERYLTSAEGNMNSKQEEFKRGMIAESDVSQGKLYLFDTRIGTCTARIDFYQKVLDLLGTLNADPAIAYAPAKP